MHISQKSLILLASASLAFGCVIKVNGSYAGERADVELEERLSIPASSLSKFKLKVEAGDLEIVGIDGQTTIDVVANIFTTEDRDYKLELDSSRDEAYLVAKHYSTAGSWYGSSPRIDLTITMPKDMNLDVDDGSGNIDISYVMGEVFIDDGSGNIDLEDIGGDITIDDGSGDLVVEKVEGSVVIDDGSGQVVIEDVTGKVSVEDGSGDINVRNIGGTVIVDDGSGNIRVRNAGGLRIVDDGSGDVKIDDIKGEVEID